MPHLVNLLTAVARPFNLPVMWQAIQASTVSGVKIRWVLVFDEDRPAPAYVGTLLEEVSAGIDLVKVIFPGPFYQWGVLQRNAALAKVEDGWVVPHDDDNVIHPDFFRRIEKILDANPAAKAVAVSQIRWDGMGHRALTNGSKIMVASAHNMKVNHVDAAAVLIHKSLVGDDHYDPSKRMGNDGDFISRMYAKAPSAWIFVDEVLAYYNYLRIDHRGVSSLTYRTEAHP